MGSQVSACAGEKQKNAKSRKCYRCRSSRKTIDGRKNIALLPPPTPENEGKKTLVLDLDETLVHSIFNELPEGGRPDFTFNVQIGEESLEVFVAARPGFNNCSDMLHFSLDTPLDHEYPSHQ